MSPPALTLAVTLMPAVPLIAFLISVAENVAPGPVPVPAARVTAVPLTLKLSAEASEMAAVAMSTPPVRVPPVSVGGVTTEPFVKLMTAPSTVMVSPLVTGVLRLLNSVPDVIAVAGELLLTAAFPVTDALVKGCAGVPATTGLLAPKSTWLRPPAAVIVLGVAFGLAVVTGTVGKLAAY